jgi:hypothetical protein
MDQDGFKRMFGLIGSSFVGERMYHVIKASKETSFITLRDYLIYQDKVMHGDETEKNDLSFRMLDLSDLGRVTFETYENFWSSYLYMYGQLFNFKVNIDAADKANARNAFNTIAQGAESFDFEMFQAAKA